jgi:steroid delta-isomerase-like uncharacterized protein
MAADLRDTSRRVFEEIWNLKNLNAVDELIAANYVHHDPNSPPVATGAEGYKEFVRYYLAAFPDTHFTVEDLVVMGNTVAIRWTVRGTHEGDLLNVPRTGRSFSVTGMSMGRIENGKFVESWNNWDALGLMQQLGALPSVAAQRAA